MNIVKVMHPHVDYDTIASTYDRRYLVNDYSGVENALVAFAGQSLGARVLDVGCGTGHWLRLLTARGFRAAGLDASIRMLAQAQACGPVVHGRAEQLPWANKSFDRLSCVNALHHFQNKAAFLADARRVLRPGGRLMTIGFMTNTRALDMQSSRSHGLIDFVTDECAQPASAASIKTLASLPMPHDTARWCAAS